MPKRVTVALLILLFAFVSFAGFILPINAKQSDGAKSKKDEKCCQLEIKWDGKNPNGDKLGEGKIAYYKLVITNKCAETTITVTFKPIENNTTFYPSQIVLAPGESKVVNVKFAMPKKNKANSVNFKFDILTDCGQTYTVNTTLVYDDPAKDDCCYFWTKWEKPFDTLEVEEGKTYTLKLIVKSECDKTQKIAFFSKFEGVSFSPKEVTLEGKKEAVVEVKIVAPKKTADGKFLFSIVARADCILYKEISVTLVFKKTTDCCYFSFKWLTNPESVKLADGETGYLTFQITNNCDKALKFYLPKVAGLEFTPPSFVVQAKSSIIVKIKITQRPRENENEIECRWSFVIMTDCGENKEVGFGIKYK